jgi:hypothetical protein
MRRFKIENWEMDGLNIEYSSLNSVHIQMIMCKLSNEYGISVDELCNQSFFKRMLEFIKSPIVISNINEDDGFRDLLSALDIIENEENNVYIIWNYDGVDKLNINTLQKYWGYIWYGRSDEYCILFFPSHHKFVIVADYGVVYN